MEPPYHGVKRRGEGKEKIRNQEDDEVWGYQKAQAHGDGPNEKMADQEPAKFRLRGPSILGFEFQNKTGERASLNVIICRGRPPLTASSEIVVTPDSPVLASTAPHEFTDDSVAMFADLFMCLIGVSATLAPSLANERRNGFGHR